jgi:formylglycine-generating enzyme required for sulfatase activity
MSDRSGGCLGPSPLAARAERRPDGLYEACSDGAVMVLIPAGPVFLGREENDLFAPDEELPGRTAWLSAYLIDRAPVCNGQFVRFVEDGGYERPALWHPEGWAWRKQSAVDRPLSFDTPGFGGPKQPVAGVSWYEADAYATWAGKQLPTEAQWEKSARGADRRLFPWGDRLPRSSLCNFDGRVGRTTEVDSYPEGVSPYGLLDMSGNVNNWCRDWYWRDFYGFCRKHTMECDPWVGDTLREELALACTERSDRGGGFATSFGAWDVLTTSGRLGWRPERRKLWNGFRCVLEFTSLL